MATLSHKLIEQGGLKAHHGRQETVHRLTLYFRSMGLPEHQALEVADDIVRSVWDDFSDPAEDLASIAVDRALELVGHWLDDMVASTSRPSRELRLQLAWFLRPILMRRPEVFAHSEDLPEDFYRAIEGASRPILPPASPAAMPAQPLGELPRLWYRWVAYAHLIWERLAEALEHKGTEP